MDHKKHGTAKDFFLHLLSIVTLYISAVSFGVLLFQLINFYFPDVLNYYYQGSYYLGAIRSSIASLIVAMPVFILVSRYITKDYKKNPEKKDLRVRIWLTYLTMFIAAVVILVSTITLIYNFLGGEITTRFVLKIATVVYIAGMIFGYYLYKMRSEAEKSSILNAFMAVAIITTLAGLVMGFMFLGSPKTQRLRAFDETRTYNLASIASGVESHYYQYNELPATLADIKNYYEPLPLDPETSAAYEYRVISELDYELCATFNLDKFAPAPSKTQTTVYTSISERDYKAGRSCFNMHVQPQAVPMKPDYIEAPVLQ